MAEIDIVYPVDGAMRVNFDYGAAGEALDALAAMSRKLSEQAEGRRGPRDRVVVNWEGHYRQEFDRAWGLLQARFGSGPESVGWTQLQIYTAIGEANDAQRRYNQMAEEARALEQQRAQARGTGPV
ncbi:MAG: hypothetical protein ACRD0A_06705 [Acidimicrobiales bacterium]